MTRPQEPSSNPNPTAVVVNDDVTQLKVLAGLLSKEGLEVRSFENAQAALEAMERNDPPDLIVTDLYMPVIDGWRFCRLLRSPEYAPFNPIPILVVSATFSGEAACRITADLGANAFLPSPVKGKRFIELVRMLLRGEKPQEKSRVLVVEESRSLASMLKKSFQAHGCLAQTALTGGESVEYFNNDVYDVVILDYHLPDIQGDELLVRFQKARPETVFIMMTTDPRPELALAWMKKGASAYLQKPFELDYLIELCNKARRERALLRVEDLLEARTRELRAREEDLRALVKNLNKAYAALQQSEERFREMANLLPGAILEMDLELKVTYANQTGLKLFGFTPEDFDTGIYGLDYIHPEDKPEATGRIERLLNGAILPPAEYRLIKKNGTQISTLWNAVPIIKENQAIGFRASVTEITELKRLHEAVINAKKMESIGTLAGGIAHDFNNILTGVIGNISLAQMDMSPSNQSYKKLERAQKAAMVASELVSKLLTFSRGGHPVKRKGAIANVLKDVTKLSLSGSNMLHAFSIPDNLHPVAFDTSQISQVIQNTIQNAKEAMPKGGKIEVIAENSYISKADDSHIQSGRYIRISIKDRGKGIHKEHMGKIFDPYFSTKKKGPEKGMGLGLSIAYSIIDKHAGKINVDSVKGKGTTVSIYLPALIQESELADSKGEGQKLVKCSANKILLMDDEKVVLDVTEQMLSVLGYQVECAKNGEGALALFKNAKEAGQPFSIVILDLTIKGGMGGLETIEKLRNMDPEVRAFVASGYSENPVITKYKAYGFVGAITKPYSFNQLKKLFHNRLS